MSDGLTHMEEEIEYLQVEANQEEEDAELEYQLGEIYRRGWKVKRNYDEAFKWYLVSAMRGNSEASSRLHEMCDKGESSFKKIAYAEVHRQLGEIYRRGWEVSVSNKEAFKWYLLAAKLGNSKASSGLRDMYGKPERTFQGNEESVEWLLWLPEDGDKNAPYKIGEMYYEGKRISPNHQKAQEWYHLSARKEHKKSLECLRILANQGNIKAQFHLGVMYGMGEGVVKDVKEAVRWYFMIAKKFPSSSKQLFEPYLKGCHCGSALRWLIVGSMLIVVGIFFESKILISLGFGAGLISLISFLFKSKPSPNAKLWILFLICFALLLT